jgi:multiple sugar transport system ATP-binding protein
VAGFIGSPKMNFLPGRLVSATAECAQVQLAQGVVVQARVNALSLPEGSAVTLGLRPEDAAVGQHVQHLTCTVQWQERLGESTYLYLDSGSAGNPWVLKAAGNTFARTGERIAMILPAHHLHVFDAQGRAMRRTVANQDLSLSTPVPA